MMSGKLEKEGGIRLSGFPSVMERPKTVSVIGTGDFGRGLTLRLLKSGFEVVVGSRRPEHRNMGKMSKELVDVQVTTIIESIQSSDVIFLAIPSRLHYTMVKFAGQLAGKVVIDVSNVDTPDDDQSMAEELSAMLPHSLIVKGFNTVSAYSLQTDMNTGNRDVYVCSDDVMARSLVLRLARDMGFTAVDSGGLRAARKAERLPHQLFSGWWKPTLVTIILFLVWGVYGTWRYHYGKKNPYEYTRFPINTLNKIFAVVGITQIALCYLPGNLASFVQLCNGTKYKRFPAWLDCWMKMRKQLGVYSLVFITIHCVLSVMLLTPAYYGSLFESSSVTVPANATKDIKLPLASRLKFDGELTLLLATLAWILMVILGITTVPAIGERLNWKEWSFIQSYVGIIALAFSLAHLVTLGAPGWTGGFHMFARKLTFLSAIVPTITLVTRLLIWLPCICIPVNRIRKGWERGSASRRARDVDVEADPKVSQVATIQGGTDNPTFSNSANTQS